MAIEADAAKKTAAGGLEFATSAALISTGRGPPAGRRAFATSRDRAGSPMIGILAGPCRRSTSATAPLSRWCR